MDIICHWLETVGKLVLEGDDAAIWATFLHPAVICGHRNSVKARDLAYKSLKGDGYLP